jgi:uncharacterized protein (TIGR02265 family)
MTAETEQRVKGTVILARMKYVRSRAPSKLDEILGALPAASSRQLTSMLLPSSWYPEDLLRQLESSIITALKHQGRSELYLDMGRAAASANLTGSGSQRAYVRMGDPHFLLKHASYIYASYYSNGTRSYERRGDRAATIRTVKDFAAGQRGECLITVGWFTRAIEICGGAEPTVVETQCGVRGAPCCEFRCAWQDPAAARAAADR